ncbi:MAG: sugar phosphate nucleotidyltransferase [candidate division WOR-3 bacterium]
MSLCVVVPAAGEGQRLRPHTLVKPKVMLEVAGKPIIGHIVDRVMTLNPERVCVVVPPADQTIRSYLLANYRLGFEFVVQPEPKGLGHAVWCARDQIGDVPVLILLGDTIVDFDFSRLFAAENAIGVKEVADPSRFGVVLVQNGVISKVIEKPKQPVSRLAIVGVYYFSNPGRLFQALDRLVEERRLVGNEYQFTDALQLLADEGTEIRTVEVDVWLDCGTPAALLESNRWLLKSVAVEQKFPGSRLIPPVHIARDAQIERSAIGPYVSVSAGVKITDSVISDSIIYQRAKVERSVLSGSIIGEDTEVSGVQGPVNLGPGRKLFRG